MFAEAYVDGWVSPVEIFNPVFGMSRIVAVSYAVIEEYSLHDLRLAAYRFLRALCFKPTPEAWNEQILSRAYKIQIPFLKLLCYVARQTRDNLNANITFASPVVVAYRVDNNTYHSSCLVCPKLDRLESMHGVEVGAHKASLHILSYHERSKIPLRKLNFDYRKTAELNLTLEQYLLKLQENVASSSRALALLDLTEEDHCFKRHAPKKRKRRTSKYFR